MPNSLSLKPRDRAIIMGTSDSGKSTLAMHQLSAFRNDYPNARILVADTKPRWRGERLADGTSTKRRYERMGPGDFIPGSVVMQSPRDWSLAWDRDNNPAQTVIMQNIDHTSQQAAGWQQAMADKYFKSLDYRRPSLIYWDEGHDFFTAQGMARGSDIVQRGYRAGRERGLTSLIGFQRTVGFPIQCLTEANICALFHIDYIKDMRRLYEMGWPEKEGPPTEEEWQEYIFKMWRKGTRGAPRYRLKLNSRKVAA